MKCAKTFGGGAVLAAVLAAGTSSAGIVDDAFEIEMQIGGETWSWRNGDGVNNITMTTDGDNPDRVRLGGSWEVEGAFTLTIDEEESELDGDPFITYSFNITNAQATTEDFVMSATMPVTITHAGPSLIRGSHSGSVLDNQTNGATISRTGDTAYYEALVDGVAVLELNDTNAPLTVPVGTANIVTDQTAGFPGFIPHAGGFFTDIGIINRFTLTAGDTAQMVSFFEIIVPTPGSTALLSGAVGMLAFGRRRSRA